MFLYHKWTSSQFSSQIKILVDLVQLTLSWFSGWLDHFGTTLLDIFLELFHHEHGDWQDSRSMLKKIDAGIKNRRVWKWLEDKDVNGIYFSEYVCKLSKPGFAICKICHSEINYESISMGAAGKKKTHGSQPKKQTRSEL